jgi:hypothetical protein
MQSQSTHSNHGELIERWTNALEGLSLERVLELTKGRAEPLTEQEAELVKLAPLARKRKIF